jgi:hypothetical protein
MTQHGCLSGWQEENDPAGQDLLMIDASESVLYRLAQPRTTKPVIETKHQLRPSLEHLQL